MIPLKNTSVKFYIICHVQFRNSVVFRTILHFPIIFIIIKKFLHIEHFQKTSVKNILTAI